MSHARRLSAAGALVVAVALAAFGMVRGTRAVGGADSSCHALMASAFAAARLQPVSALGSAPWPDVPLTLAPGGFIPSPAKAGAASPVCAPGFSLLLAPLAWLAPEAIFLWTPVAGLLLVWAGFLHAKQLAGSAAGLVAALLIASSPIVLFEVVQPTTDITSAALWLWVAVLLSRRTRVRLVCAGALAGLALLVRPNMLPLAAACVAWIAIYAGGWKEKGAAVAGFSLPVVPFGLAVLALNHALYGSPFASGYGDVKALFSAANVPLNAARYASALLETQTPLLIAGLAAPVVLRVSRRRDAVLALLLSAATVGLYLFYLSFPEWWYLRFLLPAVVLLCSLSAAVVVSVARRASYPTLALGAIAACVVALSAHTVSVARDRQAFDLQQLERRMRLAPEVVRDRLPSNAVLITVWQSGSVKFIAGREAVLWDSMDPAWLDRGLEWLRSQGYKPLVLVERWEEPVFRERFGGRSRIGGLDWPPRFDIARQVRIYDPDDRAGYQAGERVPTEFVF